MKTNSTLPWYRHPWPWFLMAGPMVVVIAGVITTWLAVRSADGLVEDDYYKQGLAVNQRIERDHEAARQGLSGELMLGTDGRQLRMLLTGRSPFRLPKSVALTLAHPTRAGLDQRLELALGDDGVYGAVLTREISGRWNVALQDTLATWRLVGVWNADASPALRLSPGSADGNRR